jgi:hypothetical protein
MTRLRARRPEFDFRQGQESFYLPPLCPYRLCDPPDILSNECRGKNGKGVKLTAQLRLVLRLMCGVVISRPPIRDALLSRGITVPVAEEYLYSVCNTVLCVRFVPTQPPPPLLCRASGPISLNLQSVLPGLPAHFQGYRHFSYGRESSVAISCVLRDMSSFGVHVFRSPLSQCQD